MGKAIIVFFVGIFIVLIFSALVLMEVEFQICPTTAGTTFNCTIVEWLSGARIIVN